MNSDRPRNPASFQSRSCVLGILDLMQTDSKTNAYRSLVLALTDNTPSSSFLKQLSAQSISKRKETLKKLNQLRGRDRLLNQNFVNLIEYALNNKLITELEVKQILADTRNFHLAISITKNYRYTVEIAPNAKKLLYGAAGFLKEILENHPQNFKFKEIEKLSEYFAILSEVEILMVSRFFSNDIKKMELLIEYIRHTRTIPSQTNRLKALSYIDEVLDENRNNDAVKGFFSQKKRFIAFRSKVKTQYQTTKLKEARSSNTNLSAKRLKELEIEAEEYADKAMRTHKSLWYSCRNITTNEVQQSSNLTYGKFVLLISPVSTTVNYWIFNDPETMHSNAFWRGLSYDIVTQTLFNYTFAKWINSPGDTNFRKILKYLGLIGTTDSLLIAGMYEPWIAERDHEKLERLLKDPNYSERVKALLTNFEELDLNALLLEQLKKVIKKPDGTELTQEDLQELGPETFNHYEIRNMFIELMAIESAKDNAKYPLNYFENEAFNRIAYHRMPYDVAGIGLDIFFNALIFQQLCSPVNHKTSVAKAALLFLTYRLIDDFIYYGGRDLLINQ